MVVDSGIHLFEWAREQAAADMDESGVITPSELDEMVDRIAILPGQLTAYDFGGLEIVALRRQAEEVLGDNFDIRGFVAVSPHGTTGPNQVFRIAKQHR
jgi:uncharacterized protein (DUF885 family)